VELVFNDKFSCVSNCLIGVNGYCAVPETPQIKHVYTAVAQNYHRESVPVIGVEWTVSDEPFVSSSSSDVGTERFIKTNRLCFHHISPNFESVSAKILSSVFGVTSFWNNL